MTCSFLLQLNPGKLTGRRLSVNTTATTGDNDSINRLFRVHDRLSGPAVSVVPATYADKVSERKHHQLLAANGSIETYGVHSILLQFGSQRFECTFVIAIVNQPILEADFFYATRPFNRLEMATTN